VVTNQTPRHNPCVLTPSLQPYRATYGCKLTRGLRHRGFYLEGDCPCVLITSLLPYAGRLGSEPRLVGQRWSGVRVSASFYPPYVSMGEGYIGCRVFSLSGYRYIGDGGTDRGEILHDGT